MTVADDIELDDIELDLLTEGIRRRYSEDLAVYARSLLMRGLRQHLAGAGLATLSALQGSVLHDPRALDSLLAGICSAPARLFDTPTFWKAMRAEVVPWLRTHPSPRLWHAGCGSPEELYSLVILLDEEGLLARSRVYVTDASEDLLGRARTGRVRLPGPADQARYVAAGGRARLVDYLEESGGESRLRPDLQERVFYSQHHLAQEGPFNEFHVVVCRNTLLRFSVEQAGRIHGLFVESLARYGYLGLGRKESLRRTPYLGSYDELAGAGRLFRRIS